MTDAKAHLNVEHTADDTYISGLISAATELLGDFLGRTLLATTTHQWYFDRWPMSRRFLIIPRGPMILVLTVEYMAAGAGVYTSWGGSNWVADPFTEPARIVVAPGISFPALNADRINAVRVTYTAGYTAPPPWLTHAYRLLVAHWYLQRESASPMRQYIIPEGIAELIHANRYMRTTLEP